MALVQVGDQDYGDHAHQQSLEQQGGGRDGQGLADSKILGRAN